MAILRVIRHSAGEIVRKLRLYYLRRMGVEVADDAWISMGAWIDQRRGKVIIGKGVAITSGCKILSHDMTLKYLSPGGSGEKITRIGDRTFIGMNCVILPGVTVGHDCIIGAGTIVSKDIPDGVVVVGGGMRVVRSYNKNLKIWEKTNPNIGC